MRKIYGFYFCYTPSKIKNETGSGVFLIFSNSFFLGRLQEIVLTIPPKISFRKNDIQLLYKFGKYIQ